MQYGFVIDHRKCIGCHACTVACKSENDVPVGNFRTWVKYTEIGTFPAIRRHFAVLRCNHCTTAPCVTICPVEALEKRPDGIVDLNRDVCIGCKACMQACPYDAIYLNEDLGAAEKCHYCAHRVEQNLEPACVVVCPERAIIAGDLHDPNSEVAQLAKHQDAQARRVEQGTGPNVFYLGMDPVSLRPGVAEEPATYLWSDRRVPPPPWPADRPVVANARTVLNANATIYWGWKISTYLVTKGIAAGVAILAPFMGMLGVSGASAEWLPELLALAFAGITSILLIIDLKRPTKFFRLLTRPNPKSWLVKGAWVLLGFTGLTMAILATRWFGNHGLANLLRLPNVLFGAMTAGYTAFLFAQCEGRDLWQDTKRLLPHLVVQAIGLGALTLLVFAPTLPLAAIAAAMALAHLGFAITELFAKHTTDNARQAASLLAHVPAWPGSRYRAFREGLWFTTAAGLAAPLLVVFGLLSVPAALVLWAGTCLGTFWYEQAFVRAGQLPPLS